MFEVLAKPCDRLAHAAARWADLQAQTDAAATEFWDMVGSTLRVARRAAGKTAQQVADEVHYAKSTILSIELRVDQGRCMPAVQRLWNYYGLGAFPELSAKSRRRPHSMRAGA